MSSIVRYLPRKWLSRQVGRWARIPWPLGLQLPLIRGFAWLYKINIEEAEKEWWEYSSLSEFFARKLKPGRRPLSPDHEFVHPADSEIFQAGEIREDRLLQVKGKEYRLEMLTNDPSALEKFSHGYFLTYYLCPTDYHRVHSPVEGMITRAIHTEGDLWPVNPWSVKNIEQLYTQNERVYVEIASEWGPVGVVFVGATNVGSIGLSFDSSIETNRRRGPHRKSYSPPIPVQKGEELGWFCFGSTVVVLYPPELREKMKALALKVPRRVKVGEAWLELGSSKPQRI